MIEINKFRYSEMHRTLDPKFFEQTFDTHPSQVVFEHVQNSDAAIRDRRQSACTHTSSYNGLKQVLRFFCDQFGVVAIAKD